MGFVEVLIMSRNNEYQACQLNCVNASNFNPKAVLPYGLQIDHVRQAMSDFIEFLEFINNRLHKRNIPRLENMVMPANFSSMIGEFMKANIPKYCSSLVVNQYHNGHPDMIPSGRFPGDAVQHTKEGIEVKGSRYYRGWQGHNPEDVWLMVFVYDSNRQNDNTRNISPKPFRFRMVLAAELKKEDWSFSGRSAESRRTITASVTQSGYQKMRSNWIYLETSLKG